MRDQIIGYMKKHKIRLAAGCLLLLVELGLFFGSGVMLEDQTHFHSGEGARGVAFSDTVLIRQEFVPGYDHMHEISILLDMGTERDDGIVHVEILANGEEKVYQASLPFSDMEDMAFTDLEIPSALSGGKTYYLDIWCEPSSLGEYPEIMVGDTKQILPENRKLQSVSLTENVQKDAADNEIGSDQLIMRYQYTDVMPAKKAVKIVILCLFTALAVGVGIPHDRKIRQIAGCLLLILMPLLLGRWLELLNYKEVFYRPMAMAWNIFLMYLIELLFLLVTYSPGITVILSGLLLTGLYSANYFVYYYRGTPLRIAEFTAVKTAKNVIGGFQFVPNDRLAFAWGMSLLFLIMAVQTGVGRKTRMHKMSFRVLVRLGSVLLAAVLGWGCLWMVGETPILSKTGLIGRDEMSAVNRQAIYEINGYLVGLITDYQSSGFSKPDEYSQEAVAHIFSNYSAGRALTQEEQEALPHIFFIMNESLADLRVYGELNLNQEYLPFLSSMRENTIRGYTNVSVFGGGTANSEFEALTGCTMAFFDSSMYPYQQMINGPLDSVVTCAKKSGYTTYSMHPAPRTNWNRAVVYGYLGFDDFLWDTDFPDAEEYYDKISDQATYDKIISLYENRQEKEKLFVFDITLQNHGGYSGHNEPYEVNELNLKNGQMDEYLSLAKISDEAFENLVTYFADQDEKVIICMFGDHHPFVTSILTPYASNTESENMMNMYKTPFVIWANYDIEEAEGLDISANYLGGMLLEQAGIPLSPWFAFLRELRRSYPIVTAIGCVDDRGDYLYSDDAAFEEYRILEYDHMQGEKGYQWAY